MMFASVTMELDWHGLVNNTYSIYILLILAIL